MTPQSKLRKCVIIVLISVAPMQSSVVYAQATSGLKPMTAELPPVRYACVDFQLPADATSAKAAIDVARGEWAKGAAQSGLKRSTQLFVDAEVRKPQAGAAASPVPARMCAIVPPDADGSGLDFENEPARTGLAGFCAKLTVEECLTSAANDAGYTSAKPWPRVPVYARWPDSTLAPTKVNEVISGLVSNMIDAHIASSGAGATVEQSTNGLVPLTPCPVSGCSTDKPADEIQPAGPGVGWFLPLAVKANSLPSASADVQATNRKP